MVYTPEEAPHGASPPFHDASATGWELIYSHSSTFTPETFTKIMMNLIHNPNINSSWLFRADILHDSDTIDAAGGLEAKQEDDDEQPIIHNITDIPLQRSIVRRLIPRNTTRDEPLNQTCTFHRSSSPDSDIVTSLVLYIPHLHPNTTDLPFYHPKVKGIAHHHTYSPSTSTGTISISFLPFPSDAAEHQPEPQLAQPTPIQLDDKLRRIAYHLLQVLHKHAHSTEKGYTKRVHHDVIIPQSRLQTRYQTLKDKYARSLCRSWAESTDPAKHVFEDLGIAAFLIELWEDMYRDREFPGFVDIGCGNGLLVYLLTKEGYTGWGFDARSRKSWEQYNTPSDITPSRLSLEQKLLLPEIIPRPASTLPEERASGLPPLLDEESIHNGAFTPGTFIISNHADELTPWTPILAALSDCPFIMIPCCSHNLTGERYRAPPPRDRTKSQSTYSSLVDWVSRIGEDCGWDVETEMLRIPSTRNTGLLGRRRTKNVTRSHILDIIDKYGGVNGYVDNVIKLLAAAPRAH